MNARDEEAQQEVRARKLGHRIHAAKVMIV
jgi:hypothetical protein